MNATPGGMRPADAGELLAELAPQAGVVGAAVGVAAGDEEHVATYGALDSEGTAVAPDSAFPVASVTKPMVATVVARLADRGLLGLDDPVAGHVTELAGSAWAKEATVRHLLANTSGLPLTAEREWRRADDSAAALASFCDDAAGESAMWAAGTTWSYCNSGWSVLARLIECVTGETWEDATRQELLGPLGLDDTEFGHEPARGSRSDVFELADGMPQRADPWLSRALGPGGASVYSSAADLVRFGREHCDDPRLAKLREEQAVVGFPWFLDSWCLGWARFDGEGGSVWGWDGIGSGSRAILRIVPEQRGVIALVANTSTGRDLYRALFPRVLSGVFGIDLPTPSTTAVTVPDLDCYAGRYAWSDLEAEVLADSEGLRLRMRGGDSPLSPIDERNFLIGSEGLDRMTVSFARFEAGVPQVLHNLVWGLPRMT